MNKNKLYVIYGLLVIIFLAPIHSANARTCKLQNAICPDETEFKQYLNARYVLKIQGYPAFLFLTNDPDTKNGFKYDVRTAKGAILSGDGKGIIDHEHLYFTLPIEFRLPNGERKSPIHCFGKINPSNQKITGDCTTIVKDLNTLQLSNWTNDFIAKPLTKVSILGQINKTSMLCLSDNCPARGEINKLLKTSYIFTANLIEGRTENYRLDLSIDPEAPFLVNFDVFDADTNSLIYGGGVGYLRYRRIYIELPIVGPNGYDVYGCTGTINPSDSTIFGECRSIYLDTTGQSASFYGPFTAVPN